MKLFEQLKDKIGARDVKIGIIGLGYVGLPLAVEFAKAGFDTTGFDIDSNRVEDINRGKSYIPDVRPGGEMEKLVRDRLLRATLDYKVLKIIDAIIICVPTPLRKTREPDISFIISSVEKVAKNIRQGHLIVLESTTYPGTTEEVILPMLKSSNLKVGKDFFLAFSPERVDPGNKKWTTKNIPKIVGGVTSQCTEIARLLYSQVIKEVIPVSSTRVAEMTKLLENTFRSVNIGLVNELSRMCHKLGVDVWEVIDAASTKPFGFMPFYPGPGLGGHCLPVDPLYLSWKARLHGFDARFIELAAQVNSDMPGYV
ncbi:MAG: nucleotide sugar dehydrogenase, partial [Candidatus Omnitrophica bacterium]|nr:nucleotide sugar dehydrogenase [Candidatus Omnitrophota bacterium]